MIDHLSQSQVSMWLRCQKQWRFRYVEKLKIPTAAMLALGSSFHEAEETNFTQKIETETDLPTEQVQDAFSDAWEARLSVEEVDFQDNKPGELKDQGIGLVGVFQEMIAPVIQPELVEHPFRLEFENVPYALEGRIDLVTAKAVRDLKTAKRTPSLIDGQMVGFDLQASTYHLADKYLLEGERDFIYDYAVKTKKPKTLTAPVENQDKYEAFTLDLIGKVAEQIKHAVETGDFVPNPTHPWACSEKFCGYWSKCIGGNK